MESTSALSLKLAYPKPFLDSIHREVKKTFYGTPREAISAEYVPTIAIPYTNFSKNFIRPILSHNRCRTVHKYGNTLKRKLVRTRPPRKLDSTNGAGVYKIPCLECDKSYIGQTGRDFRVRLSEHKSAISHGQEKSAVYQHVKNKNHPMDWKNAAILYHSDNERNRLVIESAYIKKNSTFNNTQGIVSFDSLSSDIILSNIPQLT